MYFSIMHFSLWHIHRTFIPYR